MAKINLRESLNKIDLATDNKYDLLNTFDSKKLSDENKKKLAEAIDNNSIASINRVLHESEEQLFKVVIQSGATKRDFESALYEDEAEGIVDYYDGRWIDENGFEWNMYVEEDDDSTEHAMVDKSYDIEYDDEVSDAWADMFNIASLQDVADSFKKDVKSKNKIYKPISNEGFDESLTEASYGGAYDIEDDMFFTKEEIVEFADEVCVYLEDIFGYQYDINDVYMDGPRKLYINIYDNNYIEVESTFDIDMRKIRKPSDLFKFYGLDIENWFQKAFAREYRDAGLDESLTEDSHQPWVKVGDRVKIVKNKHWTKAGDELIGLTGTVEDYNWVGMQKRLSITLDNPFTGKYGYREFLVTHATAAEDEVEIINDLTEDTIKQNGKWVNKGSEGTHGKFRTKKAADAQRKAMFANGYKGESLKESYLYESQPYSVEDFYNAVDELGYSPAVEYGSGIEYGKVFADDSTLRQLQNELMTEYDLNYNIIKDDDYNESLKEQVNLPGYAVKYTTGYSGNGVNSGKTEWFRTKEERDRRVKELKDKNYTEIKTWKMDNFYHTLPKNESLKEAVDNEIDLDYETDFDDNDVEEGNVFVEGGVEYVWIQREAGPIYLDFDKWAVWSAREYVDPREFMAIHDNGKDYDFDGDAFKKKAMAAPIVYFVVEEDTGFIDWGPEDNEIAAKDFLNGKQEDWDNDEYYGESLEKNLDEWYANTIHYEDIGDGREYDYEVDHEEVLDYLSEIAIDEEDAPEDTEEYLKWVEDNFDELFNKYAYEIEEHFREDASQEEYDRRHSSYEP